MEEEQGKGSSLGFPGQAVGSMRFELETQDDEEESKGVDSCFLLPLSMHLKMGVHAGSRNGRIVGQKKQNGLVGLPRDARL